MDRALILFESLEANGNVIEYGTPGSQEILSCLKELLHGDKQNAWMSMCLLSTVIKQCQKEIFEDNALSWYRLTLKIVNAIPSESLLGLCFENLIAIISKSHSIEKISRELATKGLEPLLQLLTGSTMTVLPITFQLITTCIKHFPGPCGRFYKQFESFLLHSVSKDDPQISSAAVVCFSWLPVCGSAGDKHIKHVESWQMHLQKVLKTIYVCSTDFLNFNTPEGTKSEGVLLFPIVNTKVQSKALTQLVQLQKALLILESLLSKSTNFVVQVPFTLLINAFCELSNIFQVDVNKRSDLIGHSLSTKSVIGKIVKGLLACIEIACRQFSLQLAPFTGILSKIIQSTLVSPTLTSRKDSFRTFSKYAEHLSVSPLNCPLFMDILEIVLSDIRIQQTNIELNAPPKEKSQKSKKKNFNAMMFSKAIDSSINSKDWKIVTKNKTDNTMAALCCLQDIINFMGPLCTHQMMDSIISCLLGVCDMMSKESYRTIAQYNSDNRLQFFKTLHTLLCLHHTKVQVPVPVILSIFQAAASADRNSIVSTYCRQSLLNFDKVVHSATPELRMNAKMFNNEESREEEQEKIKVDNWTQSRERSDIMPLHTLQGNGTTSLPMQVQVSSTESDWQKVPDRQTPVPKRQEIVKEQAVKSKSPKRSSNTILTPDVFSQRKIKSADDTLLKVDRNESIQQRRNSDPPRVHVSDKGDENNIVIVESSDDMEEEDDDSTIHPAKKRTKRLGPEDVDFEMNNLNECINEKQNNNVKHSKDDEFQDILSTFCEVGADD